MLDCNDYFNSSQEDKAYFLSEVAEATRTGVYSANFKQNAFFIDTIGREILHMPVDYMPSINEAAYLLSSPRDLKDLIRDCQTGNRFERDVLMNTCSNQEIWMRFTGKPKHDEEGEMIGVRGVFTSIDKYVREKKELEKHSQVIKAQNERLLHFAHIVSHNLRSHSSNLELTLELFKEVLEDDRTKVFYSYLGEISNNLSSTLEHLNQVVTINSQKKVYEVINVKTVVDKVLIRLQKELEKAEITVKTDFVKLQFFEYVPAFFENIVYTLVQNAIKYRDPSKSSYIEIKTKVKNKKRLLVVKDNGRGIDLTSQKESVFQAFTDQQKLKDSNGLALFLAKNQVEALGGDLVVNSASTIGSSFTVKF